MDPKTEATRAVQRRRLRATAVALVLSLCGLVVGTVLLALRAEQTSEQSLRQADLSIRLRQLQTVLVSLSDAERSQRGYLLTGDAALLAPYRQALQRMPDLVASLDDVPLADPAVARHAALAREAIEAKFTELDKSIQLHDRAQAQEALALVRSSSGQQQMDSARTELYAVMGLMRAERDRLNLQVAEGSHHTRQLALVAVSTLLLFIGLAATQIVMLYRTQQRHERALKESEDFLARTGALAGVGGWEIDLRSKQARWSPSLRHIHEVADDFLPTPDSAFSFFSAKDQALIRNALSDSAETGKPWELELPLVTATGRAIWVRVVGETQVDEQGQALRHVGALQDVTERKLLSRQLADKVRFVREITDSLPLRISYLDRESRYQFVNAAHCRRFGRPREAILGRTRSELTGGATDAVVQPHIKAVLAGLPQRFEFEEIVDGRVRLVESQLIPDIDAEGHVRGFYGTGIDITERKLAERALRDLAEIFHNTPDSVVQSDWAGRITYMNPALRRSLGLAADAPVESRLFSEFISAETNVRFVSEIRPAVKQHGFWIGETMVLTAGGPAVPCSQVVIAHRDGSGRVARYSSVMRDISAERAAHLALQRQAATLHGIIEAIPAFVTVVGTDGRYRYVNHAFERWCGRSREALIGRAVAELLSAETMAQTQPWIDRTMAGETVSFERQHVTPAGTQHLALTYIPLRLDDGTIDGLIGVVQDITVHKEEEVRLLRLSERDPLTGLLNRAGFESWLDDKVAAGHGSRLALLYIDLDHFKPVNDRHGHAVGDEMLREFARRLSRQVRPSDAVARLGGDEFAIVLNGAREQAHAEAVADKVVDASLAPFEVGTLRLFASASVGVALDAQREGGWRGMLARADAAVYRAKSAGRSRRA